MKTPEAGAPPITIRDIARVLDTTHATVSRALNDHPKISAETKRRVREAAAQLGYVAHSGARAMRKGAMPLVGLIVPDVQNEFYNMAVRAMADRCVARGYQLVLGVSEDSPEREEQQLRILRESRAAGVLLVPSSSPTPQTVQLLQGFPTVQFLRHNAKLGPVAVTAQDMAGTRALTEHLLALGHRTIAFLGPARGPTTVSSRLKGYRMALQAAGIEPDEALVQCGSGGSGGSDFAAAALAQFRSLATPPTAIVVGTSRHMPGLLRAARTRGVRIPGQLSIVCYGDADWFEVASPAITAASLPVQQMSEEATSALFGMLDGEVPAALRSPKPQLRTSLVIRGSTAAVPPAPAAPRRAARAPGREPAAR